MFSLKYKRCKLMFLLVFLFLQFTYLHVLIVFNPFLVWRKHTCFCSLQGEKGLFIKQHARLVIIKATQACFVKYEWCKPFQNTIRRKTLLNKLMVIIQTVAFINSMYSRLKKVMSIWNSALFLCDNFSTNSSHSLFCNQVSFCDLCYFS